MIEERLDLSPQGLIVTASLVEESVPLIGRNFRRPLKDLPYLAISFRRHRVLPRSIQTTARTEPDANHFVSSAPIPSVLPRFTLQSVRQRNVTPRPGFAVRQASIKW